MHASIFSLGQSAVVLVSASLLALVPRQALGASGIECPPGAIQEGEPICHEGYFDTYNSGCNAGPPVFTPLPCSDPGTATTVCGTYGGFTYGFLNYRDEDWYEIVLSEPSTVSWCATGEDETIIGVIDGNNGCTFTFHDVTVAGPGEQGCVTTALSAGTWWLFISTYDFFPDAAPCGAVYVADLSGHECGPTPVEMETWGRIKSIYR
jgi:hypothetical protein